MQVLIVHDSNAEIRRIGTELIDKGFLVRGCSCRQLAETIIANTTIDLLILPEKLNDKYITALALLAEFTNPNVACIMLSDSTRRRRAELFELVPSLRAVMATTPDVGLLSTLALQVVASTGSDTLVLLGGQTETLTAAPKAA